MPLSCLWTNTLELTHSKKRYLSILFDIRQNTGNNNPTLGISLINSLLVDVFPGARTVAAVLIHHAEFNPCGVPAFVEHTEFITPGLFQSGRERLLLCTVAQRGAVEKPPAPTVPTQGR